MRRALFSLQRPAMRRLSTTSSARSSWSPGPAPPRLPKEEQEIFEQLQQQSTGAFSTPRQPPKINQVASSSPAQVESTQTSAISTEPGLKPTVRTGDGQELHPNVRRGATPEFEGEVNPKTGEAGGPKNEPLRWGHGGDWSYNGRVSDF